MDLRRGRSGEFVCFAIVQLISAGPTGGVIWRRDKHGFLENWALPHRLTHNWVVGRSKSARSSPQCSWGTLGSITRPEALTATQLLGCRCRRSRVFFLATAYVFARADSLRVRILSRTESSATSSGLVSR